MTTRTRIAATIVLAVLSSCFCHSGEITGHILSVTPDLARATLSEGGGKIPFIVKNESGADVTFTQDWHIAVHLMTTDNNGRRISIADFANPHRLLFYSGPGPQPIVMKPGESGSYDSSFSMDDLAFAAGKNVKIFGEISGHVTQTGQAFDARSTPFTIPPELAKPPWIDLGRQNYLTVTVDTTKPEIHSYGKGIDSKQPSEGYAFLSYPITITNVSGQTLCINSEHVSFCKGDGDRKAGPDLWEIAPYASPASVGRKQPDAGEILNPGESTTAGGRSYIMLWNHSNYQGFKAGDSLVVGVAGRISGTDKVFECYSAPFTFPAVE